MAREQSSVVEVPIPMCIGGRALPHALVATLAWFTPVQPGHRSYRSVRMTLLEPEDCEQLRVHSASDQPDANQVKRGTILSRRWSGNRAAVIIENMSARLIIQREPDQGSAVDEEVPFGLAVTLTMPSIVELYDQVRARIQPRARPRVR